MFDLVTGHARHTPRHARLPLIISITAHLVMVVMAATASLLVMTDRAPAIPTMMAFVAPPSPPPPPPHTPAPAPAVTVPSPPRKRPIAAVPPVAPVVARAQVGSDVVIASLHEGIPGGVEGGIPGGVAGGVPGSLLLTERPWLPPPSLPAARDPIRVGGQIEPPSLVRRVEPIYPDVAVAANLQGIVILEAVVDHDGHVADVKVLRSAGRLLDQSAIAAVSQWEYSPLLLNGRHERFVLTVTLSFTLQTARH